MEPFYLHPARWRGLTIFHLDTPNAKDVSAMTRDELLARLQAAAQTQDRAAADLKERMASEGPDGADWHGYGMHIGAAIAYRAAAIWVAELEDQP